MKLLITSQIKDLLWDDQLHTPLVREWETWKSTLLSLENLQMRWVILPHLSDAVSRELLIYCNASELSIAAVCYLKVTYPDGSSSIGFVLGKSKVNL